MPEGIDTAGHEIAHAINLQQLFMAEAAARIGREAQSSASFLQHLDRKYLQVATEVDPVQAAAIAKLGLAGG